MRDLCKPILRSLVKINEKSLLLGVILEFITFEYFDKSFAGNSVPSEANC